MTSFFIGHYAYWFIFILMTIGLYGMIFKRNLVKKVIGMTIFQVAIIMFYLSAASRTGATVPILDPEIAAKETMKYLNPLPHTLMLTAIVVGVATSGVAYALLITIYRRYKTLDEKQLMARLEKEDPDE